MKRLFALLLLLSMALAATSCVTNIPSSGNIKLPDAPRIDIPITAEPGIVDSPEDAVADIAADTLKALYNGGENVLISPLSISMALGLTSGGAKGDTLEQFEKFLGRGIGLDEMHSFYKTFSKRLEDARDVDINVANSVWTRKDAVIPEQEFEEFAENNYNAEFFNEKFDADTVKKINSWVDKHTNGMIKEVIDEIDFDTVMYLINALSFEAKWQREYTDTNEYFKFTNAAGDVETVTSMNSTEALYIEDDSTTGFIKNYKGGEYGFAVFLPNEDISINDYVASLDGEKITSLLESKMADSVETILPKFKFEYSANLNDTLKSLGFTLPFDSKLCELDGLGRCDVGNLYIGNVIHKTFIEVAEEGTKAAAVTVVDIKYEGAIEYVEPPKQVIVNRPFVFAIIDNETNVPLFLGTVLTIE